MLGLFGSKGGEEKKVEYIELIYDLIFVYIVGRNNSLMHHTEGGFISLDTYMQFIIVTIIAIQIWSATTLLINRYGSNGIMDHIAIFINMYLMYYMAKGSGADWQDYYYQYNVAWMLILLNLALQYYIKLRREDKSPWETVNIHSNIISLLVQAAIILVSIPVFAATHLALSPLAMVFGIAYAIISRHTAGMVPVDFAHLTERTMLYVVFTFGEMVIAIAGYFEGGLNANTIYFSVMAFLIVVGLFLSYEFLYNHILDREMLASGIGYIYKHVFLLFGLSNITVALEFMQEEEINAVSKNIFLVISFLIYFVFLFLLWMYAKESCRLSRRSLAWLILLGAAFSVLMALTYSIPAVSIAITVCFVFAVTAVIVRTAAKSKTS